MKKLILLSALSAALLVVAGCSTSRDQGSPAPDYGTVSGTSTNEYDFSRPNPTRNPDMGAPGDAP